jgi:DNA-binding cell septation regulator SpoVG
VSAEPKPGVDWERIEADYRSGIKTLRVIASENGVHHATINKRAKRVGWDRDLSVKIAAKAAAKVTNAVTTTVTKKTEKAIVDANATLQADVILAHRQDVPRKRALVSKLFKELEETTDGKNTIRQLVQALKDKDERALSKAVAKVTSLPQRIKGASDLVGAYKILIGMEREVFGIKGNAGPVDEIGEIVRRVVRRRRFYAVA